MRKTALLIAFFLLFVKLYSPVSALAKVATLYPTKDSSINWGLPDKNYGGSELRIGYFSPGKEEQALLQFDLSSISASSTINSATLRLNVYTCIGSECVKASPDIRISTDFISKEWNELTITANAFVRDMGSPESTTTSYPGHIGLYDLDVKAILQAWVNKTHENYGLYLARRVGSFNFFLGANSKETGDAAKKPQLIIDYTPKIVVTPPLIIPPKIPLGLDLIAPKISNIQVAWNIDTAQVSWVTDEASDSFLDFGETATYGQTLGKSESVTKHKIDIPGLKFDTLYHYHVKSKDAKGNLATSGDAAFTTPEEPTEEAVAIDQTPPLESEGTAETAPQMGTAPEEVDAEAGAGAEKETGTSTGVPSVPGGLFAGLSSALAGSGKEIILLLGLIVVLVVITICAILVLLVIKKMGSKKEEVSPEVTEKTEKPPAKS